MERSDIMKKLIEVTQSHIEVGSRKDRNYCPVGIAVNQQVGGTDYVFGVDRERLTLYEYEGDVLTTRQISKPPRSVSRFIKRFDQGLSVRPFSFWLSVPDDL
jgi:hypothetical protein